LPNRFLIMLEISIEQLPLYSSVFEFEINQKLVDGFQKSFRTSSRQIPPTLGVRALTCMFELLNRLEVDWMKLLHVQQDFEYLDSLHLPCQVRSQAILERYRKRATSHWLNFTTNIYEVSSNNLLLRSHSTILIAETGGAE